ncbi:Transcriptional regulator KdgR [bioreactor metagenome]|uniref:Transcriptional regulator KdgR n=1 Tax=bioreactor metagenome TaxID=1076179 RepID=A0A645DCT6_9ZZZZ
MQLSKSTVHSLLSTLLQLGYVQQEEREGKYSLGLKLFELGQVVYYSMDLRAISMPYLTELSKIDEETIHLGVLSGGEVVYVDKVDSPRSIRTTSKIGKRSPVHCTGLGKVLLSSLSDDEIKNIIESKGLAKYTDNTITDPVILFQHIQEIRKNGFALDNEEIEEGLVCSAAPIKNALGETIAAISVSGPAHRLTQERLPKVTEDVIVACREISRKLGYKA